ncbi:MAG: hypothetical protein KKI08_02445 [Armatimonadetes bacterium]|nr:hypothetical protein [Armatimonadota bacterium]
MKDIRLILAVILTALVLRGIILISRRSPSTSSRGPQRARRGGLGPV